MNLTSLSVCPARSKTREKVSNKFENLHFYAGSSIETFPVRLERNSGARELKIGTCVCTHTSKLRWRRVFREESPGESGPVTPSCILDMSHCSLTWTLHSHDSLLLCSFFPFPLFFLSRFFFFPPFSQSSCRPRPRVIEAFFARRLYIVPRRASTRGENRIRGPR